MGNKAEGMKIKLDNVTEYCEERPVYLCETMGVYPSGEGKGHIVVRAINEAGGNSTEVDLLQLLQWIKVNRPDLLL